MTHIYRRFSEDFARQVRESPDKIVIIDARMEREWSWSELAEVTSRWAKFVHDHGVGPGDTISSMLPNSTEQLSLFLTCLLWDINFAPIPTKSTLAEVEPQLALVKPKLLLTQTTFSPSSGPTEGVTTVAITVDGQFDWLEAEQLQPKPARSDNAEGCLIYLLTGGTTAAPKVMVIDGDRLWSAGKAFVAQHQFLDVDSRFYNFMPMSYLGGLFNLGLIPMAVGGSLVIAEPFSGVALLRLWHEFARFEVNVLWLVPTVIRALLRMRRRTATKNETTSAAGRKIKYSFLGTAPIELQLKQDFEEAFGITLLENFALSETTFLTSEKMVTNDTRSPSSVGPVLDYASVRIAADDQGQTGPIEIKTPFLFLGYLQEGGDVSLSLTDDGYFITGDTGHFDDNDNLILDGRERDIIKKGGLLISLPEVEAWAQKAPGIRDAIAVAVPHEFYGEDYVLFVTPLENDAGANTDALSEEVREWIGKNIVQSKWPTRVIALAELPRSHSGKVSRGELQKQAIAFRAHG
jgi:acyl-CoA synthetase (AMP-forming)/AMP-acid ligase II